MRKQHKRFNISSEIGYHNAHIDASIQRLVRGQTYRNLSTVWIVPTRGQLKPKVVSSWLALQKPMNQPFFGPIFIEGMEVGEAYQKAFEMVMDHPELSKWSYVFTLEEDNLPPPDALLKMYESIQEYDCVGALYWTKGENGMPMCYGDTKVMPRNFVPQVPQAETITPCNGLGMGCNLWKLGTLRRVFKTMPKPWFKTVQERDKAFSQDLWFFNEVAKFGFKCACDARVKCGHMDVSNGTVW